METQRTESIQEHTVIQMLVEYVNSSPFMRFVIYITTALETVQITQCDEYDDTCRHEEGDREFPFWNSKIPPAQCKNSSKFPLWKYIQNVPSVGLILQSRHLVTN